MAHEGVATFAGKTRASISEWYGHRAAEVDQGAAAAAEGLYYAAQNGFLALGIPEELGGNGGTLEAMAEAIGLVSSQCLTSGFLLWCHRMACEYLVQSGNDFLLRDILPQLLSVQRFGATGLANAMKHAASLEELKVRAERDREGVLLNGGIPWSSNLVGDQFVVVVAAATPSGSALLVAVPGNSPGVKRGSYFPLTALGGTCSTSLHFESVHLGQEWLIAVDANALLPRLRRVFLVLQSALAWGLAEAALQNVIPRLTGPRSLLKEGADRHASELVRLKDEVRLLSHRQRWDENDLYRALKARKELAELAVASVWLELEAVGGAGYIAHCHTARRLREAAFLPIQSPSLVHLRHELEHFDTPASTGKGVSS